MSELVHKEASMKASSLHHCIYIYNQTMKNIKDKEGLCEYVCLHGCVCAWVVSEGVREREREEVK